MYPNATGWFAAEWMFATLVQEGPERISTGVSHSADATVTTTYHQEVLSTYTSADSKNAWAFIQDIGWRRIQPLSTDGVTKMLTLLTAAQTAGRKVHVYVDNSFIHEAYAM